MIRAKWQNFLTYVKSFELTVSVNRDMCVSVNAPFYGYHKRQSNNDMHIVNAQRSVYINNNRGEDSWKPNQASQR